MSTPTARTLLVPIFVPAKLDTVEMERHVKVDKCTVRLEYGVASQSHCRHS